MGAGLVQIYTHEDNRAVLQQLLPEAIISCYRDYNEEQLKKLTGWADVVCIGCGLGRSETAARMLGYIMECTDKPCVVDADGLNLLSENMELLERAKAPLILTPHMKEMSRLAGCDVRTLKDRRMDILKAFGDRYPAVCVLKDSRTAVYETGRHPFVNLAGNSAMAKGGAGDVLAGVITGLLAQGMGCYESASLGVYLHACGGDEARRRKGSYSVLAGDLIAGIETVTAMKRRRKMTEHNRVCAEIDLDAIAYNMEQMKKRIGDHARLIAVVKADGYGHGAVPVARCLKRVPMLGLCGGLSEEAMELREQGIRKPILVLGCVFPDQFEEMIRYDVRPAVYMESMAERISQEAVRQGKDAFIHIKIDTGMGRIGFPVTEESADAVEQISRLPGSGSKECSRTLPKRMNGTKHIHFCSMTGLCG